MKNKTRLQKTTLTYQTSKDLGASNPNHKIKTAKHQQKCGKTTEIQQISNKNQKTATAVAEDNHARW
jgi:hypothetical protein